MPPHNGCHYCSAAHSTLGRQFGIEAEALDAIHDGGVPEDPEIRGVVRAPLRLVEKEGWLEESDLSELADEGIDRGRQVEEVTSVSSDHLPARTVFLYLAVLFPSRCRTFT